jgi:uncharacterized protein (TIGR01777 family)
MEKSLKILISGATGLVGRPLCETLEAKGHRVRRLSRSAGDFQWDPEQGRIDAAALDEVDVVVHLAGETVAQRWNRAVKQRILNSRVKGAELLVEQILQSGRAIAYISASGINYYGYRQASPLDESSGLGDGFLAEVCARWEAAAQPLMERGKRCVFVRTGVVLSEQGGALEKLLPPFKAGVGGPIGSGAQLMSWIALQDLVRVFVRCIEDCSISGPVNGVAPRAVSNKTFAQTLGKVLHRPSIIPTPRLAISALFGEMASETVLSDLNILPARLKELGFKWELPELEEALKTILSKT